MVLDYKEVPPTSSWKSIDVLPRIQLETVSSRQRDLTRKVATSGKTPHGLGPASLCKENIRNLHASDTKARKSLPWWGGGRIRRRDLSRLLLNLFATLLIRELIPSLFSSGILA